MVLEVVVINLDRDAARLAHMRDQLSTAGLSFTRFAAVDGANLPEKLRAYFDLSDTTLTPGEIGCYASHLAICQLVVAGDLPSPLLVLEDDVELSRALSQVLSRALEVLPTGWDIVRLSYPTKRACARVAALPSLFELVRYSHVPTSTGAYLLSRDGAGKFLARRKRKLPVDQDLRRVWAWELDTFGVVPPPVRNDCLGDSSIGARGSHWRRRRMRIKRWLEAPLRHARGVADFGLQQWLALTAINLATRFLPRSRRRAMLDRARGALGSRTPKEAVRPLARCAVSFAPTGTRRNGGRSPFCG